MADCKTCEYEKICEMPDFVRNDLKLCKTYQEKKPQTNADRIRAMTDEELAKVFDNFIAPCTVCIYRKDMCVSNDYSCTNGILQWLKSEAKE